MVTIPACSDAPDYPGQDEDSERRRIGIFRAMPSGADGYVLVLYHLIIPKSWKFHLCRPKEDLSSQIGILDATETVTIYDTKKLLNPAILPRHPIANHNSAPWVAVILPSTLLYLGCSSSRVFLLASIIESVAQEEPRGGEETNDAVFRELCAALWNNSTSDGSMLPYPFSKTDSKILKSFSKHLESFQWEDKDNPIMQALVGVRDQDPKYTFPDAYLDLTRADVKPSTLRHMEDLPDFENAQFGKAKHIQLAPAYWLPTLRTNAEKGKQSGLSSTPTNTKKKGKKDSRKGSEESEGSEGAGSDEHGEGGSNNEGSRGEEDFENDDRSSAAGESDHVNEDSEGTQKTARYKGASRTPGRPCLVKIKMIGLNPGGKPSPNDLLGYKEKKKTKQIRADADDTIPAQRRASSQFSVATPVPKNSTFLGMPVPTLGDMDQTALQSAERKLIFCGVHVALENMTDSPVDFEVRSSTNLASQRHIEEMYSHFSKHPADSWHTPPFLVNLVIPQDVLDS
ncbi:hypothetical protein HK102_004133 [Quaeritorhiza haematococci]|nr:hypothetical protein HK102_004133 [Quaeritorhiza haematococci]